MTIQKKLLLLTGVGMAPCLLTLAVSFVTLKRVDPQNSPVAAYAAALANQMRADMMHDAIRADVQSAMMAEAKGQDEANVRKHTQTILTMFQRNLQLPLAPGTHATMLGLRSELEAYSALATQIVQLAHSDREMAVSKMPEFQKQFDALEDGMGKLDDELDAAAAGTHTAAVGAVDSGKTLMLATGVVGLMVLLAVGMLVSKSINGTLQRGIQSLAKTAAHVDNAIREIGVASQTVAQGASEQASTLEELSATSEQINSMAVRNLESCRSAAQVAAQSQRNFDTAGASLDQMVAAMQDISTHSGKISHIIRVIDGIAFQTNILALNAAVEAARAGEAGMGFSVVADEVRTLAHRSTQAARDTSGLIEESMRRSGGGQARVDEVLAVIKQITAEAMRISADVGAINAGSEEQTRGIQQMVAAIIQLQQATQATAASAEQSANVATELNTQSAELRSVVRDLTAMVGTA